MVQVGDPWTAIEGDNLHATPILVGKGLEQDLAAAGMLHEVGRRFRGDEGYPADAARIESDLASELARDTAGFGDLAAINDRNRSVARHLHRAIVTRVPTPGLDSISNS